eukprot:6484370-Amphidinium_carterae.3
MASRLFRWRSRMCGFAKALSLTNVSMAVESMGVLRTAGRLRGTCSGFRSVAVFVVTCLAVEVGGWRVHPARVQAARGQRPGLLDQHSCPGEEEGGVQLWVERPCIGRVRFHPLSGQVVFLCDEASIGVVFADGCGQSRQLEQ